MNLLRPDRLRATVGRGPFRVECLAVVDAFVRGTTAAAWPERPTPEAGFFVEGLAAAAHLEGRVLGPAPQPLRSFQAVGRGIAMAVQGQPSAPEEWEGVGFGAAMFRSGRTLDRGVRPPGAPELFDHGVGRAIWFRAAGAEPGVARLIASFPEGRRSALWRGVGFALGFAGQRRTLDPRLVRGNQDAWALRDVLAAASAVG